MTGQPTSLNLYTKAKLGTLAHFSELGSIPLPAFLSLYGAGSGPGQDILCSMASHVLIDDLSIIRSLPYDNRLGPVAEFCCGRRPTNDAISFLTSSSDHVSNYAFPLYSLLLYSTKLAA